MSWISRSQDKRQMAMLYYVTISGIPYVFSTHDLPAKWDVGGNSVSIDSEFYEWSKTYQAESQSVSDRGEIKRGLGRQGNLKFAFHVKGNEPRLSTNVPLWLSLKGTSLATGDVTNITASKTVSSTSALEVRDTTGFQSVGKLYAGLETIEYTSTTATSFAGLTRARFGSQAQQFDAEFDGSVAIGGAGAYVADHPLRWNGRIVKLYMAPGYVENNEFIPYSDDPTGADDLLKYVGVITDHGIEGFVAVLQTVNILSMLRRKIGHNLPGLQVANATAQNRKDLIRVAQDAIELDYIWTWNSYTPSNTSGDPGNQRLYGVEVQEYSDYSAAPIDITDKVFQGGELAYILARTIQDQTMPEPLVNSTLGKAEVFCHLFVNSDDNWVFRLAVNDINNEMTTNFWFTLDATGPRSFWRSLGFEGTHTERFEDQDYAWVVEFTADRKRPIFYLPPHRENPRKVSIDYSYSWGSLITESNYQQFYEDDLTTVVPFAVKIGNEVLTYTGASNGELTGLQRGQYGSLAIEHYIEAGEDLPVGQCGLAFENVSAARMLLYLMLSGSGVTGHNHALYDDSAKGTGLYIPADLVNVDSFQRAHEELNPLRDNWVIFEPTSLDDILSTEAVLMRGFVSVVNGQIAFLPSAPPIEAEETEVLALTESNLVFDSKTTGINRSERRIVNRINVRSAYDHGLEKFLFDQEFIDALSVETWGDQQSIDLDVLGIRKAGQKSFEIARLLFGAYSMPYALVKVLVASHDWYGVNLGDVVSLTDSRIVSIDGSGRGLSGVLARVLEKADLLPGFESSESARARGSATLLTAGLVGRYSQWAPSLLVESYTSTTLTVAQNEFTPTSTTDVAVFDEKGIRSVQYHKPGQAAEEGTISGITNSTTVEVASTPTLTAPFYLTLREYGDLSGDDVEKKFVYMTDNDGVLDSDEGFRYL